MRVTVMRFVVIVALGATQAIQSQVTPAELAAAIQTGSALTAEKVGVRLYEANPWSDWSRINFALTVHTPITWIQFLASRAAFDGAPLEPSDVPEEDRAKFLRVFVRPPFMIRHVALVTPGERAPLQATSVSPCRTFISFSSPGPGRMDNSCTEYRFNWTEVLRRTENGQREFDISVTAVGEARLGGAMAEVRKNYRIKRDHLRRLVWAP